MDQDAINWPVVLTWRKHYAQHWRKQHGYRCPLEEYISAGNQGLAEASARHKPEVGDFLAYAKTLMTYRMREVPRAAFGAGVWARQHAPQFQLLPRQRGGGDSLEAQVAAREIWAHAQRLLSPADGRILARWLMGWTAEERLDDEAHTVAGHKSRLRRVQRHIRRYVGTEQGEGRVEYWDWAETLVHQWIRQQGLALTRDQQAVLLARITHALHTAAWQAQQPTAAQVSAPPPPVKGAQ